MHTFLNRFTAMSVIMLACIIPAFCGEIHDAVKVGDLAKVKALLKDNPELVSSRNDHFLNMTPLHEAAFWGYKDIVEVLLTNKAGVDAKDMYTQTPLHEAAMRGYKDIVEALLANKADINAKDKYGQTPLHWAVRNFCKDVVELLLAKGAEVNEKDNSGWTPMHYATQKGLMDVVLLGLPNYVNTNDRRKDVVELLRQHGGHE
jgi:ankyrin repeat protein